MPLNRNDLVSILDGDTIPYLVAYNYKDKDDVEEVLLAADTFVSSILANTSCTHYIGFLGGTKCFRYDIAVTKPYKGQRPESPEWYKKWGGVIKAHLRDKWKFVVVNGIEADDAVSIAAFDLRSKEINYIVCGADKDLLQIEGNHYNIRAHTRQYISDLEGYRNLYSQTLIGDNVDNIIGCKGIAKVKAAKLLQHLTNFESIEKQVIVTFQKSYGKDKGTELFLEMEALCTLLTKSQPYTDLILEYIKIERIDNEPMNDILTELFG